MTLTDIYKLCLEDGTDGETARAVLSFQHEFITLADFDPRSGDPLPRPMNEMLADISSGKVQSADGLHDRLWRVCDHCHQSFIAIFRAPNEEPRRVHESIHIRQVRELDIQSFVKLSMRPGLNIRQKLASDPHLDAVRHVMSLDLPENRLVKACAIRLSEQLEEKSAVVSLSELEKNLLTRIRRWLHSDEAASIATWTNLPPNNTLLSHRDYRRVWDAWGMLERLDDETDFDWENRNEIARGFEFWSQLASLRTAGRTRMAEVPIVFDARHLSIRPFDDAKIPIAENRSGAPFGPILQGRLLSIGTFFPVAKSQPRQVIAASPLSADVVCIDLASAHPYFSHNARSASRLQRPLAWQRWTSRNGQEMVSVGCFRADGVWIRENVETVDPLDVFLQDRHAEVILDAAFRDMTDFLKSECFDTENLVWLVPDFLNDFELELPRRALNAAFPNAAPLPRSVAATVAQVSYDDVCPGYSVLVIDCVGGVTYATKLVAEYDERLTSTTHGIVWTRHPSVVLRDERAKRRPDSALSVVDENGNWTQDNADGGKTFDKALLPLATKQIGRCSRMVFANNGPTPLVCGGVRVRNLQPDTKDIAVWRDKLPALSMGDVIVDGMYGDFVLVDPAAPSIRPVRGKPIEIPIRDLFNLPPRPYAFPLRQGKGRAALDFFVQLASYPPQTDSVPCRLKLNYSYGDDSPYSLNFEPIGRGRNLPKRISARWIRHDQERRPSTFPQFPPRKHWDEFYRYPRKDGQGTTDLVAWVQFGLESLTIQRGVVTSPVQQNTNGSYFFTVRTGTGAYVRCPIQTIFPPEAINNIEVGAELFLSIRQYRDKKTGALRFVASRVSFFDFIDVSPLKNLRFPMLTITQGCNRIAETELWNSIAKALCLTESALESDSLNDAEKGEILQFQAYLSGDASQQFRSWAVEESVHAERLDYSWRKLAYCMGDVSSEWQRRVMQGLLSRIAGSDLRKSLIPPISAFAIAAWRCDRFLDTIDSENIDSILLALSRLMKSGPKQVQLGLQNVSSMQKRRNETEARFSIRKQQERFVLLESHSLQMELLLSLLRRRPNTNDRYASGLIPGSTLANRFVEIVDEWTRFLHESNLKLPFRVSVDTSKKPPELYNTPDFLYALRCYLTDDDGANAISITSIDEGSDSDDA